MAVRRITYKTPPIKKDMVEENFRLCPFCVGKGEGDGLGF